MDQKWMLPAALLGCLVLILCCIGIACVGLVGLGVYSFPVTTQVTGIVTGEPVQLIPQEPIPSPTFIPPTLTVEEPTIPPAPEPLPTRIVGDPNLVPTDTLRMLNDVVVPPNDWAELAERLEGKVNIPETISAPAVPYQEGDRRPFWLTDMDTSVNFQIEAVLRAIGEHVYFWIEEGVRYNSNDLSRLVQVFDDQIYPTNREFFGSEWSPGVDQDPRLYILYVRDVGVSTLGYFSAADEFHPLVHEYSNTAEMFVLSADNVALDGTSSYSVLAHEFQHMIHWYRDRNEDSWLNEGFSELAGLLNGYHDNGYDLLYKQDPDIQLTDWPDELGTTVPHYGSSFLFVTYFLDRFGELATQALVGHPNNGMASVDDVLAEIQAVEPQTGQPIQADDVFADWVITNYVLDPTVGDGRFTYQIYDTPQQAEATEEFTRCPSNAAQRTVHQYGVDYLLLDCPNGTYTLNFKGAQQVDVVPAQPHSGAYAFWSNLGDESDMRLTRSFDFTEVAGPLTLNYWTWYDIEADYDYVYVLASEDGGKTWRFLMTPAGTPEDPTGNSYGWGYTGLSGGGSAPEWFEQSVDLSQYAGKQVQIRFEYVTDAAVNTEGFLLDDVSILETGYFSDFELDEGGWVAEGWARMNNILPQTFRLALITQGRELSVTYIPVNADGTAQIPLTFDRDVTEVTLVVSGTTRFTRQEASYEIWVSR